MVNGWMMPTVYKAVYKKGEWPEPFPFLLLLIIQPMLSY